MANSVIGIHAATWKMHGWPAISLARGYYTSNIHSSKITGASISLIRLRARMNTFVSLVAFSLRPRDRI